ncbi:MAG: 1-(5-phosphoribosyl)-5-[(5-phosphoribosylamino)methylideneamino] imidazole-4-carboxamide isomerase [Gammaproteobacteria bacterium]
MIIYPDIELHNGRCVNLKHGSIEDPKVFDLSPREAAKEFEKSGAEWLHLIDLNGVFGEGDDNAGIIREIIRDAGIPVQVGGGIRASSVIDNWFKHGAERVVLGTAAVSDQRLVEEVCVNHPEKILISIDARDGKAVSHGWKHTSTFSALELAKRFERSGAAGIIYTDIDRYDELPESSMANTTQMAVALDCPVISSGTVRNLDDVSMLSQLPNIAGAVIGWALFARAITLEDALQLARQKTTEAAFI